MTAQQIYQEILAYMGASNLANWYVGITNDVEDRLFGYHNVHRTNGA
jgi:predicted GIY-YIG superfamily endonuclease